MITLVVAIYMLAGLFGLVATGYIDKFNEHWSEILCDPALRGGTMGWLFLFLIMLTLMLLAWTLWPFFLVRWNKNRVRAQEREHVYYP